MSTNHNRIRVADLETNESNKILKTNEIGELEFRDLSEIKADSYNDLDYTAAGKALDARQGKVLKDMIDNVNTIDLKTKEDVRNKSTNIANDSSSDLKYPSAKAVFNWVLTNFRLKRQNITQASENQYTLQLSDVNETIVFGYHNPTNFIIPTQEDVAFETGHTVKFIQTGNGPVTVTGTGISFISNQSLTSSKGETRTLTRIYKDTWAIEGQVSFENDVKLKSYPYTRNDGELITNKVLSTDENGNVKLYTINSTNEDAKVDLVNDLTSGGTEKALTAEMGKELNESKHPLEDQRLSTDQTVRFDRIIIKDGKYANYIEPFNIKASNTETLLSTSLTSDAIIAQSSDARKLEIKYNSINFVRDPYANIKGSLTTQYLTEARSWSLPDKDGAIALVNDFVTTAAGTNTRPPLIIPNGTLTSTSQNGAIERDSKGDLYTTSAIGGRKKIATENNTLKILTKFAYPGADITNNTSAIFENVITKLPAGFFSNTFYGTQSYAINYMFNYPKDGNRPEVKIEYFLKLKNGFFSSDYWGANNLGQYIAASYAINYGGETNNEFYSLDFAMRTKTRYFNNANGNQCGIGYNNNFYNTRKPNNSGILLPSECEFELVERFTWNYSDTNNVNGDNMNFRIVTNFDAFYIQQII